jgi:ribose transport system permease protein
VGRWMYAVGGNSEAGKRLGLPVNKLIISAYVICGLTAGFAGLLYAGRTGSASALSGQGYELSAVTSVVIGGASLSGDRGPVVNVSGSNTRPWR